MYGHVRGKSYEESYASIQILYFEIKAHSLKSLAIPSSLPDRKLHTILFTVESYFSEWCHGKKLDIGEEMFN